MANNIELTIITPCYNEALVIDTFFEKISEVCLKNDIKYELIFVDDGSDDNTLEKIRELSNKYEEVHFVSFSRNFGKDYAILAGLNKACGEYTVVMDVDLQDPPQLIPQMLKEIKEGDFDCIETRRNSRKGEPVIRSIFARIYCKIINAISPLNLKDGIRDFRLMKKSVVKAMCSFEETNRFSKGMFYWIGFRTKCIPYTNIERNIGDSKWSFFSLAKYAFQSIISFSQSLLYLPLLLGCIIFVASIISVFINYNNNLFIISLIFLLFSINFIFIGLLGVYIAQIHLESKKRPQYIIKEEK